MSGLAADNESGIWLSKWRKLSAGWLSATAWPGGVSVAERKLAKPAIIEASAAVAAADNGENAGGVAEEIAVCSAAIETK